MSTELPSLPGRARTYGLVLGSAAALALAALAVPLAFGHAPVPTTSAGGLSTLTGAGPAPGSDPGAGAGPGAASAAAGPSGPASGPTSDPASAPAAPGAGAGGYPLAPGAVPKPDPGAPVLGGGAPTAAGVAGDQPAGPGTRAGSTPTGRAPGRASTATPPGGGASGTGSRRSAGTGGGTPGGGPAAARTASDTGVTPDAITLGVVVTDQGAAANLGATTGQSPQQQLDYYNRLVADLNARGGIGGRQVVVKSRTVNIIDTSSQKAACDQLALTDKAFAVVSLFGVYGQPILCFTNTYGIPYLANDGAVSSFYRQAAGKLFTTQPSTLRTFANMAYELQQRGELGSATIGVLREDDYLTDDSVALEDYTRKLGHTVVDGVTSSTDVSQFPQQVAVAAQRFCAAGVTKVFLAVNSLYAAQFIRNVDQQVNCTLDYYTSDFDFQMNADTFVSGMPASYFRHARGISASLQGDANSGRPVAATEAGCVDSYVRAGGPRPDPKSLSAATLIGTCGLVQAFTTGTARAGVNPTRASFAQALAGLGAFANPGYSTSQFRPGKTDAPDSVRLVQADGGCMCWRTTGDGSFTPANFR